MVIYTVLVACNFFGRVMDFFVSWKWFKLQNEEEEDMNGFDPSGLIILQKGKCTNFTSRSYSHLFFNKLFLNLICLTDIVDFYSIFISVCRNFFRCHMFWEHWCHIFWFATSFYKSSERSWLEQGCKVGEQVIPLARNFNSMNVDLESGNVTQASHLSYMMILTSKHLFVSASMGMWKCRTWSTSSYLAFLAFRHFMVQGA